MAPALFCCYLCWYCAAGAADACAADRLLVLDVVWFWFRRMEERMVSVSL